MTRAWPASLNPRGPGATVAERILIVAMVALLGTVTGISIWAQYSTGGLSAARARRSAPCRSIEASANELAGAPTTASR